MQGLVGGSLLRQLSNRCDSEVQDDLEKHLGLQKGTTLNWIGCSSHDSEDQDGGVGLHAGVGMPARMQALGDQRPKGTAFPLVVSLCKPNLRPRWHLVRRAHDGWTEKGRRLGWVRARESMRAWLKVCSTTKGSVFFAPPFSVSLI
jgi:hypothetical protein